MYDAQSCVVNRNHAAACIIIGWHNYGNYQQSRKTTHDYELREKRLEIGGVGKRQPSFEFSY